MVSSSEPASDPRTKTAALVLSGPVHTALGVIRALARNGIPQFTVGTGTSYVSYSRWHRRLPNHGGNGPTPETLAPFLERLPVERMVLMPCSDAWVAAVARLEPTLAARFPASIAPAESLDICLDKGRFADTLARLGLPHPRTISIAAPGDVRTLWDSTLRDPFLKPRDSRAFQACYGVKAFRIRTQAEAISRVREAQQAGVELLLQEYVPGPADSHYFIDGFVDRGGSLCARFARRRVRTYPEPFGDSCCMVTISLEEARVPLGILDRLLPALRYRGVFNAQFKYDDRDGLFKLLEINPRPWGGVSLAVSCGVDVIKMAYQDALDLPVQPNRKYPIGRYWVYPSRDRIVCWRLLREGRLTPGAWIRTWAGAVQPIFCWDDPAPAIVAFLQRVGRAVRRRLRVSR
jgi:predicted ATP-grasp superfamily ATP-dependent carboligase